MSRTIRPTARWRARSAWLLALCALVSVACEWDPKRPLERFAPVVDQALAELDAGDAERAAHALAEYLDSNRCEGGAIAISRALSEKQHAGVDLSWVLFRLAESYGKRLVEAAQPSPTPGDGAEGDERAESNRQCALQVVRALADAGSSEDRARAAYLEGNLLFLGASYKEAVQAYDRALLAWPSAEGDDLSLGADAAFNRALALKWSQQKPPDAGEPDGGDPDASDAQDPQDGGDEQDADQSPDAGDEQDADQNPDGGSEQDADQSPDAGSEQDADPSQDGGSEQDADQSPDAGSEQDPDQSPDAGANEASPPSDEHEEPASDGGVLSRELLDRLLDDLERAPTVQQEAAKQSRRKVRPEDDR